VGVWGREPPRKKNWFVFGIFFNMVFADGFLILVKELGLLTNSGQWIRGLDATRSYMYIVL
jgi:hypothetical protein